MTDTSLLTVSAVIVSCSCILLFRLLQSMKANDIIKKFADERISEMRKKQTLEEVNEEARKMDNMLEYWDKSHQSLIFDLTLITASLMARKVIKHYG